MIYYVLAVEMTSSSKIDRIGMKGTGSELFLRGMTCPKKKSTPVPCARENKMEFRLFFIISALILSTPAICGTMNKCTRIDGKIEYTDQPCVPSPRIAKPEILGNKSTGTTTGIGINSISTITTLAGSANEEGTVDGIGQSARFANPTGITSDGTNLYITEAGSGAIRKLELSTGKVSTFAGKADQRGYADGIGSNARFNRPHGITNDGKYLYVAEPVSKLIRKISIGTGEVSTLAGHPSGGFNDGIGTEAGFIFPEDVTIIGTSLYVTDYHGSTVRKIDIPTAQVTTIAGLTVFEDIDKQPHFMPGFIDGNGHSARFNMTIGIMNDGKNLYVADNFNNKIRKISISTGEVSTLAGPDEATCTSSGWHGRCPGGITDGTGPSVRFSYPQYLATDGTYLYVTTSNNTIRRITLSTGQVTTLLSAEAGSTASPDIARQFSKIWGVLITDDHGLIVTDRVAHTIVKLH